MDKPLVDRSNVQQHPPSKLKLPKSGSRLTTANDSGTGLRGSDAPVANRTIMRRKPAAQSTVSRPSSSDRENNPVSRPATIAKKKLVQSSARESVTSQMGPDMQSIIEEKVLQQVQQQVALRFEVEEARFGERLIHFSNQLICCR